MRASLSLGCLADRFDRGAINDKKLLLGRLLFGWLLAQFVK
jgi:hypothetical protein